MNVAQMGRPNKILYGRLALLLHAATPARSQLCEPRTFTLLSLSEARLARSNLGGLGGRCDANAAECTDGLRNASTPAELYFERVGVGVDLRVANASEYRAWNVGSNGIVQTSGGFFGLINVLAPSSQQPAMETAAESRGHSSDDYTRQRACDPEHGRTKPRCRSRGAS